MKQNGGLPKDPAPLDKSITSVT